MEVAQARIAKLELEHAIDADIKARVAAFERATGLSVTSLSIASLGSLGPFQFYVKVEVDL